MEQTQIYLRQNYQWVLWGWGCPECLYATSRRTGVTRHREQECWYVRPRRQKESETVPIQVIERNGRRLYRWGSSGKEYATRQQAEQQARAAYAAGYRESQKPQQENK